MKSITNENRFFLYLLRLANSLITFIHNNEIIIIYNIKITKSLCNLLQMKIDFKLYLLRW